MLIAMGVLVLFAAYNFLIRPQGAELSVASSDERAGVEQGVSDAQAELLAPPDPPAARRRADAGSARSPPFPRDPAIATLLRQLQAIAGDTGMLHGIDLAIACAERTQTGQAARCRSRSRVRFARGGARSTSSVSRPRATGRHRADRHRRATRRDGATADLGACLHHARREPASTP